LPNHKPIAIVERGTCKNQKITTGTIENILTASGQIKSPALIIIGDVVKLRNEILQKPVISDESGNLLQAYEVFNEVLPYLS
jgi:siroheme synthase